MFDKVIVPLDGSKLGEGALAYARPLARGLGAKIELLRIIESARQEASPAEQVYAFGQDAGAGLSVPAAGAASELPHHQYLDQVLAGLRSSAQDYLDGVAAPMRDTGLAVTGTVREGNPAAEIVAEAEKEPDSVVTMSTHGRAGIARWALGSVADKVLHTSSRPLMTVRVDNGSITTPEAKLSRIIAPLDGSPVAEESLSTVRALARALGVEVTLVRVHSLDTVFVEHISAGYDALMKAVETEGEEYLVGISTRLRDEGVSSVDHKMVHGRPSDGIAETAQAHEGSIVVMSTHGRTGLSHWMMGSVTDSVVRQCGVPVLILRPAEGALKKKS